MDDTSFDEHFSSTPDTLRTCDDGSVLVQFGCGQIEETDAHRKKRQVQTEFGLTDDIVVLGGDEYYYFKLPHKVMKRLRPMFSYFHVYIYISLLMNLLFLVNK